MGELQKTRQRLNMLVSKSAQLFRPFSTGVLCRQNALAEAYYEEEQRSMQKTVRKIIDEDINPYIDQWEAEGQYPAKKVFKKLGEAGLLGVNKPVEYGGMGLNFKYSTNRHGHPSSSQIRFR